MTEATLEVTDVPEVTDTPDFIGHGTFTKEMLENMDNLKIRLVTRGHSQNAVDACYATVMCPVGHPDHMTKTHAAVAYFPCLSLTAAMKRINEVGEDFILQLLSGQDVAKYKAIDDAKRPPAPKTTGKKRTPVSLEVKAERAAEILIKAQWRKDHNFPERGRLSKVDQEELTRYVTDFLPNAAKKTLADMKKVLGITD